MHTGGSKSNVSREKKKLCKWDHEPILVFSNLAGTDCAW